MSPARLMNQFTEPANPWEKETMIDLISGLLGNVQQQRHGQMQGRPPSCFPLVLSTVQEPCVLRYHGTSLFSLVWPLVETLQLAAHPRQPFLGFCPDDPVGGRVSIHGPPSLFSSSSPISSSPTDRCRSTYNAILVAQTVPRINSLTCAVLKPPTPAASAATRLRPPIADPPLFPYPQCRRLQTVSPHRPLALSISRQRCAHEHQDPVQFQIPASPRLMNR
ncbi:hypothetical protein BJX63DRAFT_73678 [Aspergillus granulosus]|uniref:Uncharacterized protein n=1 Tax=Aspergillus granulosus TaxID=176169 RepID=A0ABR4HSB6_9EURO